MSRLSKSQINLELSKKGLVFASDSPEYKNLSSYIKVMCTKGHTFITNLETIRGENFSCPVCETNKTKGFETMPIEVPEKTGIRILGIDNATYNMGVSLFDDGKLVFFKLVNFTSKEHVVRLNEIRDFLEETVVKE